MTLEWFVIFTILGGIVGFFAGLLGVGGGGIMVPALTTIFLALGVSVDKVVHLALGTSMACIVFTSFASLRAHQKNNAVIWPVVNKMAIGVIVGTFAATFIAAYLNSVYLAIFFAIFMSYVALKMFIKKNQEIAPQQINTFKLISSGFSIGGVSALVSIGGGSLTVPYLSSRGFDIKKAIGTSAAIGLPISIAGTLGYLLNGWSVDYDQPWVLGFIYLPAVLIIAVSSFFTAPLGASLAHSLPVNILKKIFSVLLVLLALKMLASVI